MGFESVRVNRVDFTSFDREEPPRQILANIVFVDKTDDGLFPLAYQLGHDFDFQDDDLFSMEANLNRLGSDSFIMLGNVQLINKNEKVVSLTRGNSVRYRHLIVISYKNQTSLNANNRFEEFAAALRTLVHAMRTKRTIGESGMPVGQPSELDLIVSLKQESEDVSSLPQNIRRVFYTQLHNDPSNSFAVSHKATGRRLYELQI